MKQEAFLGSLPLDSGNHRRILKTNSPFYLSELQWFLLFGTKSLNECHSCGKFPRMANSSWLSLTLSRQQAVTGCYSRCFHSAHSWGHQVLGSRGRAWQSINNKFLFWGGGFGGAHCAACGILVPHPGIEPTPPAVEVQSLNRWTAREVPQVSISKTN